MVGGAERGRRGRPLRVLLADDHAAFRESLRLVLVAAPDLLVVGEAQDGHEAVLLSARLAPDVVVLDLAMPVLGGLAATRRILQARPGCRVLVLTMSHDRASVAAALQAGAGGYVLKGSRGAEVAAAVRQVAEGRTVLGAGVPPPGAAGDDEEPP